MKWQWHNNNNNNYETQLNMERKKEEITKRVRGQEKGKKAKLFHPDIYCLQYVSEKVVEILD